MFVYHISNDVNTLCKDDGKRVGGLVAFIVFSYLTCGIYAIYWYYKIADRLYNNAARYGVTVKESGKTFLLFFLLGAMNCGITSLYALYKLIRNTNTLAIAYNAKYDLD